MHQKMVQPLLSSLPLQILIHFNYIYAVLFFVIGILVYIYKGLEFLYATNVLGTEIFFLFVYLALEFIRLHMASRGNKLEQVGPLIWSAFFSAGVIVLYIFFFQWQTYVLKVDRIVNGIGLGFIGLETLLILLVSFTFTKANRL